MHQYSNAESATAGRVGFWKSISIRCGVGSRLLPCGCLVGRYETFDGQLLEIIDARGAACALDDHVESSTCRSDPTRPPWDGASRSGRLESHAA
jgi:hypothetical protein